MLIGRAAERDRLERLLDDARAGRSGAVLLVGDPGVGKTALLDAAVASAEGLWVVRATGFEMEADLAFAGLGALLRAFENDLKALPAPQAAALSGALGLGPPLPPGDRFTAYAGALTLLAEAAERGPLLVVVDDAHWLDPASLDALAFVARRIAAEGIAILMAAREEPPAALEHAQGIELLRVDGLPGEDATALVLRESGGHVSDAVARALAHGTRGNPLAVVEATRSLTPDQLAGRAPLPDPIPVGPGIARALAARLAPLPQQTRRALLVAAAGAGDPALVADAIQEDELTVALGPAEAAGLVRLDQDGVSFRHPLVRSCVYQAADDAERRSTHRLLAEVARRRGQAGADALARHLAAAALGPNEEAASALEASGRRAATRMGYREAADAMRRAAELSPDGHARAARLVEAGTLAMMAGRPDLARDCLDRSIREALDPVLAVRARGARAHLEMWTGSVKVAREMLVAEVDQFWPSPGPVASVMLVDAAACSAMAGDAPRVIEFARAAEARLDGVPRAISVLSELLLATGAVLCGDPDAVERVDAVVDPWEAVIDADPLSVGRLGFFLNALSWTGRYTDAHALAERLVGIGRGRSAPSMLPFPLAQRAELRIMIGDWDGAYASGSEAVALAEETGQSGTASYARCQLARLAAGRGNDQECRSLAAAVLDGVSRHESESLTIYAHAALGLLHLGMGRLDAALDEFGRADRFARSHGLGSHAVVPYLCDLVEAAVRSGRGDVAVPALARLERLDPAGLLLTRGAVERCRGLVTEDAAGAIEHLRRAVELEEQANAPFERARSQVILGKRLQSARRRQDAKDALGEALGTFEALGAAPWAERVAEVLGALGARPRVRSPVTRELTPQELQVARAAAEGMSNREIASLLFLSVKTVEFHLRHVFGKLGVRSRTELAVRLLAPSATEPTEDELGTEPTSRIPRRQ